MPDNIFKMSEIIFKMSDIILKISENSTENHTENQYF